MIPPEQLVAALERLDPRDLEVLDLSLRRHVPDEALAQVMGWAPSEVARRRAAAIEHLADDLHVERGEDLGRVLTALLQPETWSSVDESRWPASQTAAAAEPPQAQEPEGAEEPEPADGSEPERAPRRRGPWRMLAVGCAFLAALAAAGAAGAVLLGNDDSGTGNGTGQVVTRRFAPQAVGPMAAPFPTSTNVSYQYPTLQVSGRPVLYDSPGGKRKIRLPARTEWGSPRVLSVVRQRGDWLAVLAPELKNGEVGWLRQGAGRIGTVSWSMKADLSRRLLVVRKDGRLVRRARIAVGRKGNPTPKGRFAVTDKLKVSDGGPPYGCCVLALTGHQTHLPRDWPGGDRLAVHATTNTSSIGKAVSLGCMRVRSADARWLIDTIPLGTPLTVRS